jgi:hypothetical protein
MTTKVRLEKFKEYCRLLRDLETTRLKNLSNVNMTDYRFVSSQSKLSIWEAVVTALDEIENVDCEYEESIQDSTNVVIQYLRKIKETELDLRPVIQESLAFPGNIEDYIKVLEDHGLKV